MTPVRRPKLTGSACQCTKCDEVFRSVSSFDAHRIDADGTRICKTADQMLTEGWTRYAGKWAKAMSSAKQQQLARLAEERRKQREAPE